ncbi:dimethylarginine dimethylaminohydrolase family protein [Micromonospora sp. DT62]|uniref:dimethylarginine dimethylaminohydrolase family protein n=1 Tax=Micromonospora sp. DT62 TaxID=3416521 RepID=UPI003CEFFC69
MTGVDAPAAYHGSGFRPRADHHAREIEDGEHWTPVGADTEWRPLRHALLIKPDVSWPDPADWNAIQYLEPVDFRRLAAEIDAYADGLRAVGVRVTVAAPRPRTTRPLYNVVFARDQLLATPEGVVVARMGSEPRAGEELSVLRILAELGAPVLRAISGDAVFEGADGLWLRPDRLLVGTGNRTNRSGLEILRRTMAEQAVEVYEVPLPSSVQHLLGMVQFVGAHDVVVRAEICPPVLPQLLRQAGLTVHRWPEHPEVSRGQGMNFVVVDHMRVVMLADRPWVRRALADIGVEVVHEVHADELLKAAGGLACATAVLRRDRLRSENDQGGTFNG